MAKKYTMAPGHQLHHLYIRAHPTQPQHQYLRVITEYFCLWRVTYSDESAQAILYHFPGPQALLHHPHPPFYWHVIFWRSSGAAADRHTIYDRAKQLDRSSGSRHPRTKTVHQRVSQHHMTVPSTSTLATPRKRQQQSRIAGHPDHTTDVRKNREMWIYTLRSIAPHGNYGSNQTDSHTPHSTSLKI